LQQDLGGFASAFGAVRDDDVLLIALRDVDAPAALLAAIDAERTAHHRALITTLDAPSTQVLLDRVIAAATDPRTAPQADDPADDLLRPLARRPWTKLRRAVDALDDRSSDEDFHDVRLLTKRCRYTAIAVAPAFGPVAIDFAKALGKLQDALGDRNDAHVMATRLRSSAATFDAAVVFAAGEAVGKLQARAEASGHRWKRAWKRASAKDLRAWL
jgi:CHAD domain-containing protein